MTGTPNRLLLVASELSSHQALADALGASNYRVETAKGGADAFALLESGAFDAVLSASVLPDLVIGALIAGILERGDAVVLILSERASEDDKAGLLDLGAADVIATPYSVDEVMARLRAALRPRWQPKGEASTIAFDELEIDHAATRVTLRGEVLVLRAKEYALLWALARRDGAVGAYRDLIVEVWGPGADVEVHILRVLIAKLRHKLREDKHSPRILLTEQGIGYRLARSGPDLGPQAQASSHGPMASSRGSWNRSV